MTSDSVTMVVEDRVALLTLNRPSARNALNAEMLDSLSTAFASAESRSDVDVAILTGAGSAFCAGLDLKEMATSGANLVPSRGRPWPQLTKPLLGAINGAAVTGGLELALACDFLIAAESAKFADTHTRVGLVPFWGLSVLLPQAVGLRMARHMSLTGRFVSATEAFRCGLVTRRRAGRTHRCGAVRSLRHRVGRSTRDPGRSSGNMRSFQEVAPTHWRESHDSPTHSWARISI